ncbi:MAG: PAS domain-containing methyl-accepting chemotaxis protein [Pseudomonadota bacterium]
MKKNLPVTGIETGYDKASHLVSSTDLKGTITFVNASFEDVSGFTREELIGQSHNIVRHPDMPPAAFADLWSHLKAGRAWLGLVKNRCKNGNHYWVEAHVSPLFSQGQVIGYESVRVAPERTHVAQAERVYRALWKGRNPFRKRFWQPIRHRVLLTFGLIQGLMLLALVAGMDGPTLAILVSALTLAGLALLRWQLSPLAGLSRMARSITDNPVALRAFTGRMDEAAEAELALRTLRANNRTFLSRLRVNAEAVCKDTQQVSDTEHDAAMGVDRQEDRIEHITRAIREMSIAINEIARLTTQAAKSADETDKCAREGRAIVGRTVDAIHATALDLQSTEKLMDYLAKDSQEIGAIIDDIRYITEQTNLLALNAAIEAARAGDVGRGFAVVADEVRALAGRTQEATTRTQQMIEGLQSRATEAVMAMRKDGDKISEVVNFTQEAHAALQSITHGVAAIHDMNMQVAAAVEEQSMVSQNITENVGAVRELAENTRRKTREAIDACNHLSRLANDQQALVESCNRLL